VRARRVPEQRALIETREQPRACVRGETRRCCGSASCRGGIFTTRRRGLPARPGSAAHMKSFKRAESGGGEARIALEVEDDWIERLHAGESSIRETPIAEPGCNRLVGSPAAEHSADQTKEWTGLDALARFLSRSMKAQPQARARSECQPIDGERRSGGRLGGPIEVAGADFDERLCGIEADPDGVAALGHGLHLLHQHAPLHHDAAITRNEMLLGVQ